jgi:hypothetical protein
MNKPNEQNPHLVNTKILTNAVALVRIEKCVNTLLLKITLAKISTCIARVELGSGPNVAHSL